MTDGGEALETVMGRGDEEELPRYEPGAFEIEAGEEGIGRADRRVVDEEFLDRYVPQGGIQLHTMRALMGSMRLVDPRELECTQVIFLGTFFWIHRVFEFVSFFSYYIPSIHLVFVSITLLLLCRLRHQG